MMLRSATQPPVMDESASSISIPPIQHESNASEPSRAWFVASALILVIAAIARLYDLDLNPLHQDEGVNAFFSTRLYNEGFYKYDPTNYHGPTLYYFTLAAFKLFGLTTFAIRFVPSLFGIATVWLVLCLRRQIGAFGALSGGVLIAVSPCAVYMSRYFIHESLFVFFTFAVVVSALRYADTKRSVYLMLASVAAALACATKETVIISAGTLILAFFITPLLIDIRKALKTLLARKKAIEREDVGDSTSASDKPLIQIERAPLMEILQANLKWLVAACLFIFVLELFYSSFFSNNKWLEDVRASFQYWARTGRSAHRHSLLTYISWMMQEEFFALLAGLAGAGLILWRASERFLVFASLWCCGLLCAYSILPYKTPWLTLNFIIPFAIVGGYAADDSLKAVRNKKQRAIFAGALSLIIGVTLYQMIRLNFVEYDDNRHAYVYAHTHRDFLSLTNEVSKIASASGAGYDTAISITSLEYWPLPWYLRDYKRVAYLEHVGVLNEKIVIGSQDQESELQAALADRYERIGEYVLNPGVNLVLYTLRDNDEPKRSINFWNEDYGPIR